MPHYTYPTRTPGSRVRGRVRRAKDASQVPGSLETVPLPAMSSDLYGSYKTLLVGHDVVFGTDYTVISPEVNINVASNNMTIKLPPEAEYKNIAVTIKARTYSVLVDPAVSIDNSVANFLILPWGTVRCISDGKNWYIDSVYNRHYRTSVSDASHTIPVAEMSGTLELTRAGATSIRLQDPSASNVGARIRIVSTTDFSHWISCLSAFKLLALNNLGASSVSCDQANQKIGAVVDFESDGTYWIVQPSNGTWTVA